MNTSNASTSSCILQEVEEETIGALCESIENDLISAENLKLSGLEGAARERLRSAWESYMHFQDIITIYAGDRLLEQINNIIPLMRDTSGSDNQLLMAA